MKTFSSLRQNKFAFSLSIVVAVFFVVSFASAVTTISTDISTAGNISTTAGTLTVAGKTTLANASTTSDISVAGNLWVSGMATTTSAGNISTQGNLVVTGTAAVTGTLGVTGKTSLGNATTTKLSIGATGTTMSAVFFGTCNAVSYAAFGATTTLAHQCYAPGVLPTDMVTIVTLPKTNNSGGVNNFGGIVMAGSQASSTADYIEFNLLNLTGAATSSYAQATTSIKYLIIR